MLRLGRFLVPALIASVALSACDSGDGNSGDGDGDTATETSGSDEGMDASASGDGDGDAGDGDAGDGDGDSGDGDGDTGDGDGDTGDGDGDTGDGDGDTGDQADVHAEAACEQFLNGTPTPMTSVMAQADANQVILLPGNTNAYQVTLNEDPEGGYVGWVNMTVEEWGSTQAIFVSEGIDYELVRADGMPPVSKEINLACPETEHTDERIFFPHWGDAQIRFSSTDQSEVWVMFFPQL